MNNPSRSKIPAILLAVCAAGLLLGSLRLVLWHLRMEAPQYKDEEALKVKVYPGAMRGDLREIRVLNQYIGVHLPEDLPQVRWLPAVLVSGAVLSLVVLVFPLNLRRRSLYGLSGLLALAMVCFAAMAQWQMYRIGHERDTHTPLQGIHDFTTPFIGSVKIANFHIHAALGPGAWLIGTAILLLAGAGFSLRPRRYHEAQTIVRHHHHEPAEVAA